jgi:hypothetical protein
MDLQVSADGIKRLFVFNFVDVWHKVYFRDKAKACQILVVGQNIGKILQPSTDMQNSVLIMDGFIPKIVHSCPIAAGRLPAIHHSFKYFPIFTLGFTTNQITRCLAYSG